MAENLGEWPSKRGPISKIGPSDGCGRDAVPLAVARWYDFHEFGGYLGYVGVKAIKGSKIITRISAMKRNTVLLFLSIILVAPSGWAQNATSAGSDTPGPHLVSIDYEALYQMPKPPEYKPFSFYGAFIFALAKQETPLIMDIARPTPDNVLQTLDVVFKEIDGIKLGLDVYQPSKDDTPNPLILITHGGAWEAGDKALYRSYGIDFAALGYTVAAVNYRLSGQAPFPAAIEDIRDSIVYLRKNATKFNIDPKRLVIFGSSAGGHLSAFTGLAANTPGASYLSGIDAKTIKAHPPRWSVAEWWSCGALLAGSFVQIHVLPTCL